MEKINVLVVDDETLVREMLREKLERELFVHTVHEAWNEHTFLQAINNHAPDIVLLDMKIPGTSGLALFKKLGSLGKLPSVIAFTGLEGNDVIINFLKAGVDGLVLKYDGYGEILKAINNVWLMGAYFSKEVKKIMKANLHRWDKVPTVLLTRHEIDFLKAIGKGLTNAQMGALFKMTEGAAGKFKIRLKAKLNVRNGSDLMIYACHNGII